MSARVTEARRLLRDAQCDAPGKPLYRTDSDAIAAALVLATLEVAEQTAALAEQQRIGNRIAIGMYTNADGSRQAQHAVTVPVNEYSLDLVDEIKKGLGL